MLDLVIVGAGTSGLMCATLCKESNLNIVVLEQSDMPGKKLNSSGNGRCNVTNAKKQSEILKAIYGNSKFMLSALSQFSNNDIVEFFEKRNIPLKEEEHGKIFPVSNKASDITDLFVNTIKDDLHVNEEVIDVQQDGDTFTVTTNKTTYITKGVLLACGGPTYPQLSGSQSGYQLAKGLQHTVTPTFSVCCPFHFKTPHSELMGTTLESVNLYMDIKKKKKLISTQNVLFTHYGITGPAIFEASYEIQKQLQEFRTSTIYIGYDIKHETLLNLLSSHPKKHFTNTLSIFTNRYLKWLSTELGLDEIKNDQLSNAQIDKLYDALCMYGYEISKPFEPSNAFVTAGGVNLKEVSPSTMMSKIHPNLYFSGELLDLQAYTGGYNITIAFSTAYLVYLSVLSNRDNTL